MTSFSAPGRWLRVLAPCKVNLTLDVGPRRADGYHDLDSVVATFSPADELTVRVRPGPRGVTLTCDDPSLPTDARNLVYRAARAFLAHFACDEAVEITVHLAKRIPAQAGLGGGSSDAAATLRALDRLFPQAATPDALLDIAAGIGSDVPLFLGPSDGGARLRGRGERIAPLPVALPALHGVLLRPGVGVPTGPAYALLDALPGRQPGDATGRLLAALQAGGGLAGLGAAMGNDFEAAVLPAFPPVAEAHRAAQEAGALRALLCGSGSAVFVLARDRDHARSLAKALHGRFPWVKLATMTAAGAGDDDA
jgi:4-diphosphocytidyl-2-C-methyl-D-erythritol kinase